MEAGRKRCYQVCVQEFKNQSITNQKTKHDKTKIPRTKKMPLPMWLISSDAQSICFEYWSDLRGVDKVFGRIRDTASDQLLLARASDGFPLPCVARATLAELGLGARTPAVVMDQMSGRGTLPKKCPVGQMSHKRVKAESVVNCSHHVASEPVSLLLCRPWQNDVTIAQERALHQHGVRELYTSGFSPPRLHRHLLLPSGSPNIRPETHSCPRASIQIIPCFGGNGPGRGAVT